MKCLQLVVQMKQWTYVHLGDLLKCCWGSSTLNIKQNSENVSQTFDLWLIIRQKWASIDSNSKSSITTRVATNTISLVMLVISIDYIHKAAIFLWHHSHDGELKCSDNITLLCSNSYKCRKSYTYCYNITAS